MKTQVDTHYLNPRLVAIYDLENPWAKETDYYLSLATKDKMNIHKVHGDFTVIKI